MITLFLWVSTIVWIRAAITACLDYFHLKLATTKLMCTKRKLFLLVCRLRSLYLISFFYILTYVLTSSLDHLTRYFRRLVRWWYCQFVLWVRYRFSCSWLVEFDFTIRLRDLYLYDFIRCTWYYYSIKSPTYLFAHSLNRCKGGLTISITAASWFTVRLTTTLQNPPELRISAMLSLIVPPAFAGTFLGVAPIWLLTSIGNDDYHKLHLFNYLHTHLLTCKAITLSTVT